MTEKFADHQEICEEKVRVVTMEKKNLQDELRAFVKMAGQREATLEKELKQLKESN